MKREVKTADLVINNTVPVVQHSKGVVSRYEQHGFNIDVRNIGGR